MNNMFSNNRFHIIIVGTGGTGGNLATRLCQFLVDIPRDKYVVTLIDGDTVEKKNLKRQPFLESDIGKNKSESLASILSEAYDMNIRYNTNYISSCKDIEDYIESSKELYETSYSSKPVVVICGCVDNMHARKCMHEFFEKNETVIYIDSGNEFSYGEVVFGAKKKGKILSPDKTFYFPDMFEEADMTPRAEESCEVLNNSSPQHLVTNVMAANIMMTGLAGLMTEGTIPTGIVHFDSFKFFMRQDEYVPPRDELRIKNVLGGD